jgi:hypothetical protein
VDRREPIPDRRDDRRPAARAAPRITRMPTRRWFAILGGCS